MNKRLTYKVLRHWENNVVASEIKKSREYSDYCNSCDYCKDNFFLDYYKKKVNCKNCIIYKDTGEYRCEKTPWYNCNYFKPETIWEEFLYLLNLAYSNGEESLYMDEIE